MSASQSLEPRLPGILLVDDDSRLLTSLALDLRKQGFTVWIAGHGLVAWQLYERHQADIDLVLLDVDMPFFDGPDTLDLLREINPDLPCWFMTSGLSHYAREELLTRASGLLHKPICLEEVTDALCQTARH
jgi:CheY-like chemotaxis protein